MSVTSKRIHTRYAHEAAVTLHVGGKAHQGHTSNVSRGGLCANLPTSLPVGTEVDVELQLVFDDGARSDSLHLAARVVWCTKLDEIKQTGLAFRPLGRQQADYLNLFLSYLDRETRDRAHVRHASVDERFS